MNERGRQDATRRRLLVAVSQVFRWKQAALGREFVWRVLTSTNSHGWRSAQQPATRPDVEWCVAEGRRGRVWAAEARDRIDLAVGRAVARAARSVRSAGAGDSTRQQNQKRCRRCQRAARGRLGDWANRGSKEGRGCCRRRDKHAREMSLREGQRPPENGTLAIRGGWCPGQHWSRCPRRWCWAWQGEQGSAASREIEWLFFPGSPPRRHKRAVLSSLQGPLSNPVGAVPHDSETTKFQWARRARSSYPPGLLRCDGPKRRRRLSSFLLGYCLSLVVVRSASWRIGDSGIFNPVGVDNNVLLSRGRWIGTGDTRSGSRPK